MGWHSRQREGFVSMALQLLASFGVELDDA